MRNLSVCTVLAAFCLWGCNSSTNNAAGNKTDTSAVVHLMQPKSLLGDDGTQQLIAVLNNYYDVKDALVATSAGKADAAAAKLSASALAMKEHLAKDSVNAAALNPLLDTIIAQSKAMGSMMDEGCEHKRLNFEKVSAAVYDMLKKAQLSGAGVYHEFCPMAFDEKGAYWLSNNSEIKNPYFGDKMLECGEVTDSLK